MKIAEKTVAAFHYTLTSDEGEVLDSSEGQDPLFYLHGAGNIVPGLEKALDGLEAGADFEVHIDFKDGYGAVNEELIHEVTKSQLQGTEELKVGMMFTAQNGEKVSHFTVMEIEGENVTVDGNHPMAGQNLNFKGKVDSVRQASEEELEHGHVHGTGGHQH